MTDVITLQEAEARINSLCDLMLLNIPEGCQGKIKAIFGAPTTESSFKSILGLGLLVLARRTGALHPGQPVIESTSGSLGVGLACAGNLLGHPIHLISDINIPKMTLRKLRHLNATVHLADKPHPVQGMQRSRDDLLRKILADGDYYWTDQNNSPLNPEVYRRWLIPKIDLLCEGRRRSTLDALL